MVTHSFGPSMPQGLDGMRKFVSERSSSGASGRWTHVVTIAEGESVIAYGTESTTEVRICRGASRFHRSGVVLT